MAPSIREVVTEFATTIARRSGLFDAGGRGQPAASVVPAAMTASRLTPAQRDRTASFAREWMEGTRRTGSLTDREWAVWEVGARKYYEAQGMPWPEVVVRVPSPIVGALAPAIAARIRDHARAAPSQAVIAAALRSGLGPISGAGVESALCEAVRSILDAIGPGEIRPAFEHVGTPEILDGVAVHAKVAYRTVARHVLAPVLNAGAEVDAAVFAAAQAAAPLPWRRPLGERALSGLHACAAFMRDVFELPLAEQVWQRSREIEDAWSAGYWWAFRDFVVVCDLPTAIHTEGPDRLGRLHNESGPAIGWGDGWGVYVWHGTRVPDDLIQIGWDVRRIMSDPSVSVRRCAIERMGWNRFAIDAGLKLVDEAADPANPGQVLRLYTVPRRLLDQRLQILVCTNATGEPDGARRSYGLTVPPDCRSALAAAAWTFDVPESRYAQLARAT